ncbi:nipped-B-like protein B [Ruditapes philippinarum]|uniref:nipped-B-like protein B n=1 Tax=Ruditapes philippinarum TaxID=129788 RepID=UPI00295AA853|nr:nipped-B-like protein B [Ruditapes philippinarum]
MINIATDTNIEDKDTDKIEGRDTDKIEDRDPEKKEDSDKNKIEDKDTNKIEYKDTDKIEGRDTDKVEDRDPEKIEDRDPEKIEDRDPEKIEDRDPEKIEDLSDLVGQATWAIQNNKLDYALDLLKETDEKVHQRNKLIRIADTSEGGWETMRQYEINPVASDSEDENKISKAENRALRKRKRSQQKKSSTSQSKNALLPGPPSYGRNPPLQSWGTQNSASATFQAGASTSNFRPYSGKVYGSCFACGDFSHYRKDCPYVSGTYTRQRYPTGTNEFILDVITNGYKIPFFSLPPAYDGFGCDKDLPGCQDTALSVKNDLLESGFVPKAEKSLWVPVQNLEFLGTVLDSTLNSVYIPDRRVQRR